ncbi:hypothetical protein C0992_007834 [Termitomyces sp. T32_za158]|nr:hypothetical protein C0992_007834 [Termitomyces sp. T32_za158]
MSNTQNNKPSKGKRFTKKVRSMFSKSHANTRVDESASPPRVPDSMAPVTDHGSNAMIKNILQTVQDGIELLLKKSEKALSGTPLQIPVAIVNALNDLKDAVSQNNDELNIQIARTTECLDAIKNANNSNSADLVKDFAG